jgi:hypothetical protein
VNVWSARWERNYPSILAVAILIIVLVRPGWFPVQSRQMPVLFGVMIGIATLIIGFAIAGLAFLAGSIDTPGIRSIRQVGLFDRIVRFFGLSAGSSLALVVVALAGLFYSDYGSIHQQQFYPSLLISITVATTVLAVLSFIRLFRALLRIIMHMHRTASLDESDQNTKAGFRRRA